MAKAPHDVLNQAWIRYLEGSGSSEPETTRTVASRVVQSHRSRFGLLPGSSTSETEHAINVLDGVIRHQQARSASFNLHDFARRLRTCDEAMALRNAIAHDCWSRVYSLAARRPDAP